MLHRRVLFLTVAVGLAASCASKKTEDASLPPDSAAPTGGTTGMTDAAVDQAPMGSVLDAAPGDLPGTSKSDVTAPVPVSITQGPYAACQDFEAMSPSTGCICSWPSANSSVCLPTCKTDADCPAPPTGGPAVKCVEATGGLFSYCVMLCGGGEACPNGYTCSGMRTNIGPFCAVPGTDISDLASRYDSMPFDNQQPAKPSDSARRLCGAVTLSGQLAAGDLELQRQIRLKTGCQSSPAMYHYLQDVYPIELVGPGPHQLELDSCGHAPFGMALMVYQRPGSATPYDTANLCRNMIASAVPSGRPDCAGGIATRFVGLQPGTVYLVVSSESPGATGAYQLTVKSSTSACP